MPKLIDLTGRHFGRLTVIRRAENNAQNKPTWLCKCDCGEFTTPSGSHLQQGLTQSCGCRERVWRHGFTSRDKSKRHPLYQTWSNMIDRCKNPNNEDFKNYGGRGITVCKRWTDINIFIADIMASIGERPPGLTIDRIDNNGNYQLGNVRWATRKQQRNNQRRR